MTVSICPLYEDALYTYTKDLSSETFNLSFRWSDRAQGWLMTIADADEIVIVRGVLLVPLYPLLEQYSLEKPIGEFFLVPIEQNAPEIANPRKVFESHYLVYDDRFAQ